MIDLASLWDFSDPVGSEARLRTAMESSQEPETGVLRTQVARALGLQEQFDRALAELDAITSDDAEVHVRVLLERGRVLRSRGDATDAEDLFGQAVTAADAAGLDELSVDAMHMVALGLEGPAQIDYTEDLLTKVRAATVPGARAWVASLLNNLGMAYADAGRWPEALRTFEEALTERASRGDRDATNIARWMVAWALRNLGRGPEALAAQRALKSDLDAAGVEDPYVDEEIAILERERRAGEP